MRAKHALIVGVVLASFAAGVPAQTSAPGYGGSNDRAYGYREDPGYSYPRSATAYSYSAAATERGTVESVQPIAARGDSSGAGAVIGGIAGGALGNQVGNGAGNAAATIGGVLGGAYLGNELERRRLFDETYRFHVRMDDGSLRTFTQDTPEIRVGNRVRVTDDGQIVPS